MGYVDISRAQLLLDQADLDGLLVVLPDNFD
jgi:hypothetical protein